MRFYPNFSSLTYLFQRFFLVAEKIAQASGEALGDSVRSPHGAVWEVAQPFVWKAAYSIPSNFHRERYLSKAIIQDRTKSGTMKLVGDQDWMDAQKDEEDDNPQSNPGRSIMRAHGAEQSHRSGQVDVDTSGEEVIYPIAEHKSVITDYGVQEHNADVAGLHWDLQINLDGYGHRWVIKKMEFPKVPGDQRMVVQQPTHAPEHIDWSGTIKEGYGKGTVKIAERGELEVLNSGSDRVEFVIYDGPNRGRYYLKRMYNSPEAGFNYAKEGEPTKNWMLIRMKDTPSPPHMDRPTERIKDVKVIPDPKIYKGTRKYDGTHSSVHQNRAKYGMRTVIISRKPAKATNRRYNARGGVLHQEDNIPHVRDMPVRVLVHVKFPNGSKRTFDVTHVADIAGSRGKRFEAAGMYLKGEKLYAFEFEVEDFDGNIFHVEVYHDRGHAFTGGLLNSGPIKSRKAQEEHGRLRVVLLDVKEFQGKDVSHLTYEERYELMRHYQKYHPEVELAEEMPEGVDPTEWHEEGIRKGWEGSMWIERSSKYGEGAWYKVKGRIANPYVKTYYIVGFTETKEGSKRRGKHIGAILYSDKKNGKPIGKVGTGISHDEREIMYNHQDEYIGTKITVESRFPIEKGKAVRAPVVHEIHRGTEPNIKQ